MVCDLFLVYNAKFFIQSFTTSAHLVSSCLSRIWPDRSSVWLWEGFLHPLRPDRSPLHHAGAHRLRPEAHVPSGLRSSQPPAAFRPGASASHCCPLPAAAGSGGALLLCGSGSHIQRTGGVVVVLGRHLLLLHLSVHHRIRGFRSRGPAGPEVQEAVSAHCHVWVQLFLPLYQYPGINALVFLSSLKYAAILSWSLSSCV